MGLPIVEAANGIGWPVTEAANGYGLPVTVAANGYGRPVVYVSSGGYPVVTEGGAGGIGLPALSMNFIQGFGQSGGSITPVALMLTTVRATPPLAYADSTAGVWTSFPPSIPRITDKGLLVEEARTNSIRNNSMTGAVAGTPGTLPTNWSETSVPTGLTRTISLTTINGIDVIDINYAGTTTSTAQLQIRPDNPANALATNGQVWTGSMFLSTPRDTGITNLVLAIWMYSSAPAFLGASANYSAFADRANFNRKIMPAFTIDQATTASITFPIATNSITSGTPVDITLRIGWPQLELGAFVTSPIRTTTVAVTRAADVVTSTAVVPAHPLSLFVEAMIPVISATGPSLGLLDVDDAGADGLDRTELSVTSSTLMGNMLSRTAAGLQANIAPVGLVTAGTLFKLAGAAATDDFAMTTNGGTVATDTSGLVTVPLTRFSIGNRDGGTLQPNGYIRRVAYWSTRLTNAQLQALTSSSVSSSLVNEMAGLGVPYPLADYMTRTFVPSVP